MMGLMRFLLVFLIALMALNAGAVEVKVKEKWSQHMVSGVNTIQTLDIDMTGPKVYTITYGPVRADIIVYTLNGEAVDNFVAEPKMRYLYPTEAIRIAYICDIGRDGVLDIVAGSETHTGGINKHILYKLERRYEEGLKKYYTYMNWKYEGSDLTTSIEYFDMNGSGMKELLTSDRDGKIRVFDLSNGEPKENFTLDAAVWDMQPFLLNESEVRFALGMFRKLAVAEWGEQVWSYDVATRFNKVHASDVNADGGMEVVGATDDTLYLFNISGVKQWDHKFESIEDVDLMRISAGNYTRIVVASKNNLFFLDSMGALMDSYDVGEKVLSLRFLVYNEENALIVGTDNSIKYLTFDVSDFKRSDAKTLDDLAVRYFAEGEFNASLENAAKAVRIYEELGDQNGSDRMNTLSENASDIMEAEGIYDTARTRFLHGDYFNSTLNAKRALDIFEKTGYVRGIGKSRVLISGVSEKRTADDLYNAAEVSYLRNRLSDVFENASKALEIYVRLNYTDGIERTRALLYVTTRKANTTQTTQTTLRAYVPPTIPQRTQDKETGVLYAAVILTVVVVLYMFYTYMKGGKRG